MLPGTLETSRNGHKKHAKSDMNPKHLFSAVERGAGTTRLNHYPYIPFQYFMHSHTLVNLILFTQIYQYGLLFSFVQELKHITFGNGKYFWSPARGWGRSRNENEYCRRRMIDSVPLVICN